jgi:hypothetical protein
MHIFDVGEMIFDLREAPKMTFAEVHIMMHICKVQAGRQAGNRQAGRHRWHEESHKGQRR